DSQETGMSVIIEGNLECEACERVRASTIRPHSMAIGEHRTIGEPLSTDERANANDRGRGEVVDHVPEAYAVILCAVQSEYEAIQAYFEPEEPILSKGTVGYKSRLKTDNRSVVVLLLQSMGNVSAALETQHAIDVWRPRF